MLSTKWRNYPEYCYPCNCIEYCGDNIKGKDEEYEKRISRSCKMDRRIDMNEDSISQLRKDIEELEDDKRSYEGMNAKIDLKLERLDQLQGSHSQIILEVRELSRKTLDTFAAFEERLKKLEAK